MLWIQTHRHEDNQFLKCVEGCGVVHNVKLARMTRISKKINKSKISPRIFPGDRQPDKDLYDT